MNFHWSYVFALFPIAAARPPALHAQDAAPQSCTECHQRDTEHRTPGPPQEALSRSVHASLDCTDCHESITVEATDAVSSKPHGDEVAPVNCGECHDKEAEVYLKHGRLQVGKDPDIPACWSCHGTHDILHSSDRHSHVHPINLPKTCETCHTDVDLVKKHDVLRSEPITLYESSVHGKASLKGLYVAATCNDCHSGTDDEGKRTAHRILDPGDPQSTIYHFNIPDTCAQCHKSIAQDYWDGIHGQRVRRGRVDAPVCTHCHGEHGIISPSDPRSPVGPAKVAEATCAPCHESVVLNEKYGVPAGRLRSYIDSYHGLKSKAGDVYVANCASCHGAHRILPHTDPTSSIFAANLRDTCGKCHPGISAELAGTAIHATATGIKTGWPHFFTVMYLWIIGVTISLMLLHNILDWVRHVLQIKKKPFVLRMTLNETMQHWVLMISFTVLVISGFALRFSEAWWVEILFGWGGGKGFMLRGTVHRVAAVVFIIWSLWHLIYLFTARGRRWFRDMIASKSDITHIGQNVRFFFGRSDSEPRYGRFSYTEKCEYWALLWGTVIMTATGLLLWFDNYFIETWKLPKGVLDVMLVIHYYEAWLATLAIFVWHIYGTVFRPSVYPMNTAWLAGRMSRDLYDHEHPDGPRLKARTQVFRYEEEEAEPSAAPAPEVKTSAVVADRTAPEPADAPAQGTRTPGDDKRPAKAQESTAARSP